MWPHGTNTNPASVCPSVVLRKRPQNFETSAQEFWTRPFRNSKTINTHLQWDQPSQRLRILQSNQHSSNSSIESSPNRIINEIIIWVNGMASNAPLKILISIGSSQDSLLEQFGGSYKAPSSNPSIESLKYQQSARLIPASQYYSTEFGASISKKERTTCCSKGKVYWRFAIAHELQ